MLMDPDIGWVSVRNLQTMWLGFRHSFIPGNSGSRKQSGPGRTIALFGYSADKACMMTFISRPHTVPGEVGQPRGLAGEAHREKKHCRL